MITHFQFTEFVRTTTKRNYSALLRLYLPSSFACVTCVAKYSFEVNRNWCAWINSNIAATVKWNEMNPGINVLNFHNSHSGRSTPINVDCSRNVVRGSWMPVIHRWRRAARLERQQVLVCSRVDDLVRCWEDLCSLGRTPRQHQKPGREWNDWKSVSFLHYRISRNSTTVLLSFQSLHYGKFHFE